MAYISIGKVSKMTSITRVTLRYYEKIGLLPKSIRSDNGYRMYPLSTVPRLHFIINLKSLGFSLDDIKNLLSLHDMENQKRKLPELNKVTEQLNIVKQKIRLLLTLESSLTSLVSYCDGKVKIIHCPLMQNIFEEK